MGFGVEMNFEVEEVKMRAEEVGMRVEEEGIRCEVQGVEMSQLAQAVFPNLSCCWKYGSPSLFSCTPRLSSTGPYVS